jgi:hypothetical protein
MKRLPVHLLATRGITSVAVSRVIADLDVSSVVDIRPELTGTVGLEGVREYGVRYRTLPKALSFLATRSFVDLSWDRSFQNLMGYLPDETELLIRTILCRRQSVGVLVENEGDARRVMDWMTFFARRQTVERVRHLLGPLPLTLKSIQRDKRVLSSPSTISAQKDEYIIVGVNGSQTEFRDLIEAVRDWELDSVVDLRQDPFLSRWRHRRVSENPSRGLIRWLGAFGVNYINPTLPQIDAEVLEDVPFYRWRMWTPRERSWADCLGDIESQRRVGILLDDEDLYAGKQPWTAMLHAIADSADMTPATPMTWLWNGAA